MKISIATTKEPVVWVFFAGHCFNGQERTFFRQQGWEILRALERNLFNIYTIYYTAVDCLICMKLFGLSFLILWGLLHNRHWWVLQAYIKIQLSVRWHVQETKENSATVMWMCLKNTHTHTSAASYPSLAVRQMSSPSWPSFTVVKSGSSKVSSGDTRGGAGGGGEQPPQHSPSAEPSERLLASRAKPGWEEGRRGSQTLWCPRSLTEDQEMDVCLVFFVLC